MTVIEPLFGVSWDALDKSHLVHFLEEAGDEGLTWEAKGGAKEGRWLRREQIEKAVSGFANSQLGGVLVIGAEREGSDQGWVLTGLLPPSEDEVELAISKVIRAGVQPVPAFRVKVWPISDGKKAAVLWIPPIDRPPAITRDGRVFERTTGATEPVKDPAMLSRLFEAGMEAERMAADKALRASRRALDGPPGAAEYGDILDWNDASSQQGRVCLGVSATAYEPSLNDRLHRLTYAEEIESQMRAELVCVRAMGNFPSDQYSLRQSRESLRARLDPGFSAAHAPRFFVIAHWDGSIGVACLETEGSALEFIEQEVLKPLWSLACRLTLLLGGSGQLHLALCGSGPMHSGHRWPSDAKPVRHVLELRGDEEATTFEVAHDDLQDVMNELWRSGGQERWTDDAKAQ